MDLIIKRMQSVSVCAFRGSLDTTTSPDAEKKLRHLVREGNRFFVFDFAGISYLSSAAIRMLLVVHKDVKGINGRIIYTNLSAMIADLFDLVGLSPHLEIRPTVSEAARAMLESAA